jgi:hypothetical protein
MDAKWSRALALLLHEENLGLLEGLVLEVLEERLCHSVINAKQTQAINQYNATNMCHMNAYNERGSDSKNSGERINEFGVTVAKI